MGKRQIVNIVSFLRGCEPRADVDLFRPLAEQVRLMRQHRLRGTFLVQYDVLLQPAFTDFLKTLDPTQFELGVWHEIVQPETEALGIPWTGRYPWDWHVHCGFSVGYTRPQRAMLADALFERFKAVFGYYPRVFGSWFFDSFTLRHLCDKYGLDAVCNCKEQYGTDGYTLWGGYYGQGYYPSRTNCFMPAQSAAEQLPVPLFRMLGSDPVYQFDAGADLQNGARSQPVVTLEPVYTGASGGGGVPAWVDWYLKENYNGDCLSFGYAQAGQENSFGWEAMARGLTYQFARFEALQRAGKLTVEPLGDTGRWYRQTYGVTPASAITAHTAFDDPGKASVWYSSRFYRVNVYAAEGELRLRDLHVFSERCPDPFEDTVCTADDAAYDTLPVADGNRFTGNGVRAGLWLRSAAGKPFFSPGIDFTDRGSGTAVLRCGEVTVTLSERSIRLEAPAPFRLTDVIGVPGGHMPTLVSADAHGVRLSYRGTVYGLRFVKGTFDAGSRSVLSADNAVEAEICEPPPEGTGSVR